jgi:hypothetical protein
MSAAEAAVARERENLRLSRRRVLQQIEASSNPRHRKLLQDALTDLEERLQKLEESGIRVRDQGSTLGKPESKA